MKHISKILFVALALIGVGNIHAPYAQAEEAQTENAPVNQEGLEQIDEERKRAMRDASNKAYGLINAMMKDLSLKQQQHFTLTYSNYNIIQTVRIVRNDVSTAVQKCGENNPDMKASMDSRFSEWEQAVDPVLTEAKSNLDNMLIAQDYGSKQQMDEIFEAIDQSRDVGEGSIKKIPVTTPEACTYLRDKMDETQEGMVKLLRNTLISYPRMFSDSFDESEPQDTPSEAVAQ